MSDLGGGDRLISSWESGRFGSELGAQVDTAGGEALRAARHVQHMRTVGSP